MGGGWRLGGVREGGTEELETQLEGHVECLYHCLYLLAISNVHVLDVVAGTTQVKEHQDDLSWLVAKKLDNDLITARLD